jgi:hypothetical protein
MEYSVSYLCMYLILIPTMLGRFLTYVCISYWFLPWSFFYCTEILCMQDQRHTHLAIKERQIASEYLAIHDCQSPACLTKQIIQKENILFYIHGTFNFIWNRVMLVVPLLNSSISILLWGSSCFRPCLNR